MGEIASMGEDIDALAIEKGVAAPTVWMDGKIIGTWKWHKNIKTTNRDGVEITTLRKIDAATKHRLRPNQNCCALFFRSIQIIKWFTQQSNPKNDFYIQ